MIFGTIPSSLNLAVFFSFWFSLLYPGIRVLERITGINILGGVAPTSITGTGIIGGMPSSDIARLHFLLDFSAPAFGLYFLLRFIPLERWMKVNNLTQVEIFCANTLITLFCVAGMTLHPSNGISIWLALGLPAIGVSILGFVTLLFQSIAKTTNDGCKTIPKVSNTESKFALAICIAVSFAFGAPLLLSSSGGFRLIAENQRWMNERCSTAGATLSSSISGPILVDKSMLYIPGHWTLPVSTGIDFTSPYREIVEKARIPQAEWEYRDQKTHAVRYLVYKLGSPNLERMDSPTAKYMLTAKSIVEKDLSDAKSIFGGEIYVTEIKSSKVIATMRYYTSAYPRIACGQSIGEIDFIKFLQAVFGTLGR